MIATQMRMMATILMKIKKMKRKVIPRLRMKIYVTRMMEKSATVPLN